MKNQRSFDMQTEEGDILDIILEDHKSLKQLIEVLKDDNDTVVEGDVEHGLANQLIIDEIKITENKNLWSARVKVLAEMVEHHIEEEEEEMFPDVRKNSELEERAKLGTLYMQPKAQIEAVGNFMPVDLVTGEYAERHMQH